MSPVHTEGNTLHLDRDSPGLSEASYTEPISVSVLIRVHPWLTPV